MSSSFVSDIKAFGPVIKEEVIEPSPQKAIAEDSALQRMEESLSRAYNGAVLSENV